MATADGCEPEMVIPTKKRKSTAINENACIFCQKSDQTLTKGSTFGIQTIKERYAERKCICEEDMDQSMLNISLIIDTLNVMKPMWHAKSCYSVFCSKTNIERLRTRKESEITRACISKSSPDIGKVASHSTRSYVPTTDWKLCIFCQKRKFKGSVALSQVMTPDCNNTIHAMANSDITRTLSCKIGALNLIAYEAKYHSDCFKAMQRQTECFVQNISDSPDEQTNPYEQAFSELASRLDKGFAGGAVYTLVNVTTHFHSILETHELSPDAYNRRQLKHRLMKHYGEKIQFIQPLSKTESLLIIPSISTADAILAMKERHDVIDNNGIEQDLMMSDLADDETSILRAMHHVSAKLKYDITKVTSHNTYDHLDREHCEALVPESLYIFLCMLLSHEYNGEETDVSERQKAHILSIAQDIIYTSSKGTVLTPKHIGIGLAVHHATRSKSLIQLLHASGHTISYDKVRTIETTVAKQQCEQFERNGKLFVPDNLVKSRFVQFAADNIDIAEETVDGKGTFHATQMAAFQRGPPAKLEQPRPIDGSDRTLRGLPYELNALDKSHYSTNKRAKRAVFAEEILTDYFKQSPCIPKSIPLDIDLAWILNRLYCHEIEEKVVPSWTAFNQKITSVSPVQSVTGYMPIIPSPATEYDTIWTVIQRCQRVSEHLGQENTVITVDEGIYCKARELVWCHSDQCKGLVLRLGGFHIMMNFLKVIGKHFEESGLSDVLVESGVYGASVVSTILNGKGWNRAIRCHKLAYEALWRVLWHLFVQWMNDSNRKFPETGDELTDAVVQAFAGGTQDSLLEAVSAQRACIQDMRKDLSEYIEEKSVFPTFRYWTQYIELVQMLLNFIRAEREGNWQLHMSSFKQMLPWFAVYDHVNYTRWGLVYLADMSILPQTAARVFDEFENGNFVVKKTSKTFNQLSVDQALEHVNKQGKVAGGLIGITRSESAREKWCLTYNDMAMLSESTRHMLGVKVKNESEHIETGKERLEKDEADVEAFADQFRRFNVLEREDSQLYCISTNDVATEKIKVQLLSAQSRGSEIVDKFVESRLAQGAETSIHAPLEKQNSKTFKHTVPVFKKRRNKQKL